MVGLSIVLEAQEGSSDTTTTSVIRSPQVINKLTMAKTVPTAAAAASPSSYSSTRFRSSLSTRHLVATTSSSSSSFLDQCFLCKHKLLPAKDIYMYKGDRAFCSVECRCRQIFMDEEETSTVTTIIKRDKSCSLAAMRPRPTVVSSSSSSPRNRKGTRNPTNGFAAY